MAPTLKEVVYTNPGIISMSGPFLDFFVGGSGYETNLPFAVCHSKFVEGVDLRSNGRGSIKSGRGLKNFFARYTTHYTKIPRSAPALPCQTCRFLRLAFTKDGRAEKQLPTRRTNGDFGAQNVLSVFSPKCPFGNCTDD